MTAGAEPAPKSFRFQRQENGVALLTLDRPERLNALTFQVYEELGETFRRLQGDDGVRAVVVTGSGAGFCSGGDLDQIVGALARMPAPALLQFTRLTGQVVLAMRQLRKPIVAAVNGVAVGGGAVIALAADLRIVSETARFGFVFPRLGLSGADMGAAWLLPRIVGLGRATELLLTGAIIDAATADRYGLCTRVVPAGSLDAAAAQLAAELAAGPTFAHGVTKEMLNREADMALATALEAEAQAQALCLSTHDFQEGYEAAIRRRAPKFEGR